MIKFSGFWSYVRKDDNAERGRIKDLANDIVMQYEAETNSVIENFFLDVQDIKVGDNFQEVINQNIDSAIFFIAILSPRFFASESCRMELDYFLRKAKESNVSRLLFPILYYPIKELLVDEPEDPLLAYIKSIQYFDFTEIRFYGRDDSGYRRAVHEIVQRLIEISDGIKSIDSEEIENVQVNDEIDELGWLDHLELLESNLDGLPDILSDITDQMNSITDIVQQNTSRINQSNLANRPYAEKTSILRQLSIQLNSPVDQIQSLSSKFLNRIKEIDLGVRSLIELSRLATDPHQADNFFTAIHSLKDHVETSYTEMEKFRLSLAPLMKMSRFLRPVLTRLSRGISLFQEASNIIISWDSLIP